MHAIRSIAQRTTYVLRDSKLIARIVRSDPPGHWLAHVGDGAPSRFSRHAAALDAVVAFARAASEIAQ